MDFSDDRSRTRKQVFCSHQLKLIMIIFFFDKKEFGLVSICRRKQGIAILPFPSRFDGYFKHVSSEEEYQIQLKKCYSLFASLVFIAFIAFLRTMLIPDTQILVTFRLNFFLSKSFRVSPNHSNIYDHPTMNSLLFSLM